jgi:predicted DNA-binding transcriptional regulator YafY
VWYLVAAGRGQPRTYRVSSIVRLRPLPGRFTRPDGFDLATFWQEHVERYERADTDEVAVVRLTPNGIKALPGVLGPKAARAALDTLEPADPDGWQRATIPMEGVPHAAATLLRLGADVQALAPPDLVTHLTDHVQALARLYPA